MSSPERFGYEWNKYSEIVPQYELQFSRWVYPLKKADFIGQTVLDAGCGMGRNSYWSLQWGARQLVAFDFDERSVQTARKNLANFPQAQVVFKNIYNVDWQEDFDIVFSIGVIHHLQDPSLALKKLVNSLKTGGKLVVWVYSLEGNEWIVRFIDPIRKHLTSKLPVFWVDMLSHFFSVPLWAAVKVFRGPSLYFQQLALFKFWHIHSIVFDQLIPRVAHYWQKEELICLFKEIGLSDFEIYRTENNVGWTIVGVK